MLRAIALSLAPLAVTSVVDAKPDEEKSKKDKRA
jgi:hypothetical protein